MDAPAAVCHPSAGQHRPAVQATVAAGPVQDSQMTVRHRHLGRAHSLVVPRTTSSQHRMSHTLPRSGRGHISLRVQQLIRPLNRLVIQLHRAPACNRTRITLMCVLPRHLLDRQQCYRRAAPHTRRGRLNVNCVTCAIGKAAPRTLLSSRTRTHGSRLAST